MLAKKAIGPVVATALLIVIAVVAVIGFQNWFGMYSSEIFVKTEKESGETSNSNIETLIGDQLYFKNAFDENLSIKQIKLGNRECNISVNISNGVHNISLGSCVDNLTLSDSIGYIIVITDKNIYTKKHLFKDVPISSFFQVQGLQTIIDDFSDGVLREVQFNGSDLILNESIDSITYSSDLCTGGTASASSQQTLPSNAFDNNEDNWWVAGGSVTDWLKYDFGVGNSKDIVKLRIKPYNGRLKDFTIQYSDDDFNWFNASDFQHGNNELWEEFIFNSVGSHRYWRVYVKLPWSTTEQAIREMEMMEINSVEYNYSFIGNYTSKVYNAGDLANWSNLNFNYQLNEFDIGIYSSDLCNGGVANASTELASGITYLASYAFDNDNSLWWISDPTGGYANLEYDFGESNSYSIKSYSIRARDDTPIDSPLSWTFLGSNDGFNWNLLDTQTLVSNWIANEKRVYNFNNLNDYRYYKIKVTKAQRDIYVTIGEMEMMEKLYDNTYLTIQTRTSNDNSIWTNWSNYVSGTINNSAQYFQYRVLFESENQNITPILKSVSFDYQLN